MVKSLDLKKISILNKVPLIDDKSIDLICQIIKKNKIKKILEIGSGLGFSASKMGEVNKLVLIDTIEKKQSFFKQLTSAFKNNSQIKVIFDDVLNFLNYEKKLTFKKYQLIFLDGPKKSLLTQVNYFLNKLTVNGIIIVDNIFLNKIRKNKELMKITAKQNLIKAIDLFCYKILNNSKISSKIINIGDGLLIIWKGVKPIW